MKLTIIIVITLAVLVFGYLVVSSAVSSNKKLESRVYNVEKFIENDNQACIFMGVKK